MRQGNEPGEESARLKQADPELQESQELLSSMATAAMDATVMIDPQGVIRYWNPAAEQIFGYTAAEVVGRGPSPFLSHRGGPTG